MEPLNLSYGRDKKVYWTTGEVAKILRVTPSAIRYWLMEFGFDAGVKRLTYEGLMRRN